MTSLSSDSDRIRVLIVDDHRMVRNGLEFFLEAYNDIEMVGEAESGEEAVTKCVELKPDVVLMDMVMPGMDGASATREIHQVCPAIQVLALTSFPEEDLVQKAMQAGAIGYLLKNVCPEDLVEAIRAAKAGRRTLAPEAAEALISAASQPPEQDKRLTAREIQVLELMIKGYNNTQIADQLVVSRYTVKHHVSNILSKLGTTSRTEAATLALQNRLVTLNQK